ncbi:MAG: creatininase family protein [Nitrospirae bacterium]|nr:MAG: creatininase family protein [Nitrospirota bacterium]
MDHTKTVLIPFGTIEEHGSHLPLFTDSLIVERVLIEVSKRRKVFLSPTLHYGVCTSTRKHPGTISISPDALRKLTYDMVKSFYEKGLRRFFLISGHAGSIHMVALREVGEVLIEELSNLEIAVFSLYDIMLKDLVSLAETKNDSHAGEIETSLMLYLTPHLVKGMAEEEYPTFPKPFIVKDKLHYWPGGVWGNPKKASKEKGERVFNMMVDKVIEIIDSM